LSSLAREATEQLLADTAEAIEEEHRLTEQRKYAEQQARAECGGISRMAKRLDTLERTRRDAAREARRKERADIEASLPDPDEPDAPHTANAPGFGPPHVPGSGPSDYSEDAATGVLPTILEKGAPPEIGDHPVYKPAELKYPQKPISQTPTGIGGN
jgi:hypothetical protein